MVYNITVKKKLTFDLYMQMLRNCLTYFSKNSQIRDWCINWWESVHYFPRVLLSVYFCFASQICTHAQFYEKIKTNASRLYLQYLLHFSKGYQEKCSENIKKQILRKFQKLIYRPKDIPILPKYMLPFGFPFCNLWVCAGNAFIGR